MLASAPPAAPLIAALSGYYTPDGWRHGIAATGAGKLHEVFYGRKGKGIARLACFESIAHVAGFYAADEDYQIVIAATPDGNVHEIFFKPNDIHFSQPPLARFDGIVDIAGFYAADDKSRIVIVATRDGNITEVFYHPSIGTHISRPALARFDGIVAIAGFYAADDKSRIVIVATRDGNLTEIFYHPSIGTHISQPALARFDGIVDIAGFYAADDKSRIVIVATRDGNLTEIFYHPSIGTHISQPPLARFDGIVGIAGFYAADDKSRIVIVATQDGNLTELFYHPSIGTHISHPALAAFPVLLPSFEDVSPDPTSATTPGTTFAHVSTAGRSIGIVGGGGTLYTLVEKSGVWKSKNGQPWTQLTGSPSRAALVAGSQLSIDSRDVQHVVVGNLDGGWESSDGGASWRYVFDPTTRGCSGKQVSAVACGQDGTLFFGTDCGVARRTPGASSVDFFPVSERIRALAVSETKIWARTSQTLLVTSDNGRTWQSFNVPAGIVFDDSSRGAPFSLAAFDSFAYMVFTAPGQTAAAGCARGTCGADIKVLIFIANAAAAAQWKVQNVMVGPCNACDGTGLGGTKFASSFISRDSTIPRVVGQGLQLFVGTGQEVYQANGVQPDGTISSWNKVAVTFAGDPPDTNIHADIWGFNVDTAPGGSTAWVACDGGIFSKTISRNFGFGPGPWSSDVTGLHTHQAHTLTVLPTTPVSRSRLAYPTSDNDAWCRDSSAIVLPPPAWEGVGAGGDVNFTIGDSGLPRFALLARHRATAKLKHFGGTDTPITIWNYKSDDPDGRFGLHIGPDGPTTFQFIQAPKGSGSPTLDAVMLTDLPLIYTPDGRNYVAAPSTTPLGQDSGRLPVLLRNRDFAANPDINIGRGAGWNIEIQSFPSGTQGFYVTGTPKAPVYFAFSNDASGLSLSRWNGAAWSRLAISRLVSSGTFGPAFVNPYDQNVLYVLTQSGIQVSRDGGNTFSIDSELTAFVRGPQNGSVSNLAHIAFNYENPNEMAAVTTNGSVLFGTTGGVWADLSSVIPTPRGPFVAAGIDCESIYVVTDGRGLIRINDYRGVGRVARASL